MKVGDRVELTPEGAVALNALVRWPKRRTPPKGTVTWVSLAGEFLGVRIGQSQGAGSYPVAWWQPIQETRR